MREALAQSGLESGTLFITAALAIPPTAVWVYALVGWMLMGEMDTALGVVGIFVAFGVGFVAAVPPVPVLAPIALAVLYLALIVFPVVKRQLDRQALIKIDVEQIERVYEMIAQKPNNAMLKFKLADALYTRGLVGHAVKIAEESLEGAPKDAFRNEYRTLERWKRAVRDPSHYRPIRCLRCGQSNGAGEVHCSRCGAPYLSEYARGRWLGKALAKRLVASWVAASVSLVGLPLVLQADMDLAPKVLLVVVQMAVAGVLMWHAFVRKEEHAA
ncbi:MAG TPA: hypothetical protein VNI20_05995 [Fimbriimonadaceae bacterium]|nr:hypothetical protein [Fimbriimonadaceae bacterium]